MTILIDKTAHLSDFIYVKKKLILTKIKRSHTPFPQIIVYRPKVQGIIVFFSVLIHYIVHYTSTVHVVPFRFPRLLYGYRYNIFIRPQLFGDQSSDKRRTLLCMPIILVFSL